MERALTGGGFWNFYRKINAAEDNKNYSFEADIILSKYTAYVFLIFE